MLRGVDDRLHSQHHSVGNAVESIKPLTLCLRKAWYKKHQGDPEAIEPEFPIDALTRTLIGNAWGDILNPEPERRIEIETEVGIISGRVDLDLHEDESTIIPVEIKATYYSKTKPLADMGQFVEQLGGYVLATPESKGRGILAILHLSMPPLFRLFDIQFADHELVAWEAELTRRVKVVLAPDVLPSLADHYDWECKYCDYNQKYGGPCPGSKGKTRGFFVEEEE